MSKKLNELALRKKESSTDDQRVIESLQLEAKTLETISQMKDTAGWKILGLKLREELQKEIGVAVKGNVKINVLLDILSTVETQNASKLLEEEIEKIIPS